MISPHDAKKIGIALLLACSLLGGWVACQETEAAPVGQPDTAPGVAPGSSLNDPRDVSEGGEPQDQSFLGALLFDREPIEIEVPTGAGLSLRLLQPLSNRASQPGQGFQAELAEDVLVGRTIAIPTGARVTGTVRAIDAPRKNEDGPVRLALSFDAVELPSGGAAPLHALYEHVGEGEVVLGSGTVVRVDLERPTTVEVPKDV